MADCLYRNMIQLHSLCKRHLRWIDTTRLEKISQNKNPKRAAVNTFLSDKSDFDQKNVHRGTLFKEKESVHPEDKTIIIIRRYFRKVERKMELKAMFILV